MSTERQRAEWREAKRRSRLVGAGRFYTKYWNRSAKGARYKALWAAKKRRPAAQAKLDRVLADLAETQALIERLEGGASVEG